VGRIARGWDLSIKSFALIERQRRLLLYPLVSILLTIVAAVIIFAPVYAWWTASGGDWPWIGAFAVLAVGLVVNLAVGQLFRLVLYEYATSGQALGPFQAAELDAAFKPKRRFFGRS
jgi:hypothetical protein